MQMKVGNICVPAYTIISMAELEGKTYIYIRTTFTSQFSVALMSP